MERNLGNRIILIGIGGHTLDFTAQEIRAKRNADVEIIDIVEEKERGLTITGMAEMQYKITAPKIAELHVDIPFHLKNFGKSKHHNQKWIDIEKVRRKNKAARAARKINRKNKH